ncbi:hypothetical protein SK128_009242 [Halocaridina rubra]|uniref:Peptidase M13 N-terminal domain-containing protein n=1 Tax=Halocaridina rubra TaxID=373956 RepID=A0AAN9A6Y3_HALRR
MRPVGNSRSQDGQGGGYEGPRYDSVQADPFNRLDAVGAVAVLPSMYVSKLKKISSLEPLSHLRNDEGGYLGPAALENINLEMPSSTAPHHQNVRPSNSEVGNNISTTNNNYPYRGTGKMNPQSVAGSLDMDTSSSYKSERNGGGLYSTLTCRDRSGCEQALLMTGAILLIIIITLAIGIGFVNSKGINTQVSAGLLWGGPTCQSQECVKAAGAILESLDESVDPCHNFVQFACGGWHANHPVPEAAFRWSMLDVLDETTLYELKHLLEEPPEEGESLGIQAARKMYQACVNDTAWTEIGLAPLIDIFGEVGGLPLMTPNWTASGYQLESLLAWARRLGWMPIISLAVSPDLVNNSNYAVYLGQGDLELPLGGGSKNASSLKEFRVKFMKRTALELLKVVGLEEDEEAKKTMETDIEELWNFSVELAEISIPANSITDPWLTYTPVTIDAFTNFTDHEEIPLKSILCYSKSSTPWLRKPHMPCETFMPLLKRKCALDKEKRLTSIFIFPECFNICTKQNVVQGPDNSSLKALRRAICRYNALGKSFCRWHDCAAKSRILLKVAVGQLYFKKHSLTNIIDMAEQMISDITLSFRNLITSATWMSPNATKEAMTKLDNMIKLVAYPSYIFNDTEMDKHLDGMPEISTTDHFGNVMNLTKWISMRSLMKLSQPPVRRKWVSGPLEINAFYSAIQNALSK